MSNTAWLLSYCLPLSWLFVSVLSWQVLHIHVVLGIQDLLCVWFYVPGLPYPGHCYCLCHHCVHLFPSKCWRLQMVSHKIKTLLKWLNGREHWSLRWHTSENLRRVRLGSIRNKNDWNNASKRLFGSYSHSVSEYLDFYSGYSAPRSRIAVIYSWISQTNAPSATSWVGLWVWYVVRWGLPSRNPLVEGRAEIYLVL